MITHQLEITLRDVKPAVWRRVLAPSSWHLGKVLRVIETAMGWEDHADMREWIHEGFDPKAFDLVGTNAALQHIR